MMNRAMKRTVITMSALLLAGTATLQAAGFTTATSDDTTPPIISNVQVVEITNTQATITWDTDEIANSHVTFSASGTTGKARGDLEYKESHGLVLTRMQRNTSYSVTIASTDLSGNRTTTTTSFTTTDLDVPVDPGTSNGNITSVIMYLLQ